MISLHKNMLPDLSFKKCVFKEILIILDGISLIFSVSEGCVQHRTNF